MIQQTVMLGSALMGAGDPESHVTAHGLAPIFPHWNIALPFGDNVEGFWFTNHLLMSLVAAVIMLVLFTAVGRRYRLAYADVPVTERVPRGFVNAIEGLMDALRTNVVRPILEERTDRFMPFLWTLFFYILICNLLGMIPVDAIASFFGVQHIGGTPTGNVNVTGGLALCAFLMFHYSGIREVYEQLVTGTYGHHHHEKPDEVDELDVLYEVAPHKAPMAAPLALLLAPTIYVWNFAPHAFQVEKPRPQPGVLKRLVMLVVFVPILAVEYGFFASLAVPGAEELKSIAQGVGAVLGVCYALNAPGLHPLDFLDVLMWGFLFVLEVIGALVKPFALCIRLFANMVAGHIVLASLLMLIPVFKGLTAGYLASSLTVVFGCVAISCLELFVAFLQAYIFMFLSAIFIGAAVHPEH